jgi:hypothetical protein
MTDKNNVTWIGGEDRTPPGQPVENIVAMLETFLAEAKAGKIRALGIVALDENGFYRNQYDTDGITLHELIGAIQRLSFRILVEDLAAQTVEEK